MAQNLETTLTDADRALYHTYGVAIRHAEAQIWGNPDLSVFTDVSTGASCVIAAPNPDLLLGVVRDARGLHVERHIEMAGSPCDSFTLTREGGTCWEYMASGEQVSYEVPALPRIVLGSILRRFTDPHPGRGGYLQFLGQIIDITPNRITTAHILGWLQMTADRFGYKGQI